MGAYINLVCLILFLGGVLEQGSNAKNVTRSNEEDDSVVVEDPFQADLTQRNGRQIHQFTTINWFQPFGEGSSCLTSTGTFGICTKFHSCKTDLRAFSYGLQQNFGSVNQWFLRGQASCSFMDLYGRQLTGVCCMNPKRPLKPDKEDSEDDSGEEATDTTDNRNEIDGQEIDETIEPYQFNWPPRRPAFPIAAPPNWPPPIPTHGPSISQWPPPIPTHPPNHHYPTHPPHPGLPTKQPPVATTARPTYRPTQRPISSPTSRPTQKPTHKPSYPTYPSYPPTTTEPTSSMAKCGVKNGISMDQERIVGGQNSSPNEWPWIVVLFNKGKQFCGGSLIDNIHVLTAAHCVARMTSWDVAGLTAHLGDHNIRTSFEVQHVERRIKRLVRHKGFEFSTLHNDVAVLTLDRPVTFTKEIRPVCLPYGSYRRSYSGQVATVAGWGSLRENGPQPSILQKVTIPIWNNLDCARKYGRAAPGGIIDSMLCAGQSARDSCSGDSGGPLMVNEGTQWTQVGIVSWGIGCGKGQYPGVYSRVTSFLPWILKNLK